MNRDARRAAKRRQQRKQEKRDTVERTGPAVSLGDVVAEFMSVGGRASHAELDAIAMAPSVARTHDNACEWRRGYACLPDCETDDALRKRLQERFG